MLNNCHTSNPGSRGLGLHVATSLLKSGASLVIITARKAEPLKETVKKLNQVPGITGKAVGIAANAADTDEIARLLKECDAIIQKEVGSGHGIDILIANAGATWGGPFEPTPDWSTQKILDLNVRGVFNLVRLAVPLLTRKATDRDPSRVVIVSSIAGLGVPRMGDNATIMYSVSKAAATHLGQNLAVELGPRNVTTNVIAPGFFPSKLADGLIQVLGGEEALSKNNPRGRLGEPDDIAGVVLFLCSPAAAYLNGVMIPIDGGSRLVAGQLARPRL